MSREISVIDFSNGDRLSIHVSDTNTSKVFIGIVTDTSGAVLGPLSTADLRRIIFDLEVMVHAIETADANKPANNPA